MSTQKHLFKIGEEHSTPRTRENERLIDVVCKVLAEILAQECDALEEEES